MQPRCLLSGVLGTMEAEVNVMSLYMEECFVTWCVIVLEVQRVTMKECTLTQTMVRYTADDPQFVFKRPDTCQGNTLLFVILVFVKRQEKMINIIKMFVFTCNNDFHY